MQTKKIVITGGPCSGKTTVIDALEKSGFTCIHEFVRDITKEEKKKNGTSLTFTRNPIATVANPLDFNTKILNARITQYKSVKLKKTDLIFFDRGIPDVLAYMECFGQSYSSVFKNACTNNVYDIVFLMPPWPEIYTTDNERFEGYDEALLINDALIKIYTSFGYALQIVPKTTVAERIDFILEQINTSH